ncbi:hypothetical protein A6J71_00735 [Enterobacter cancerogenus]|uniref:ead/Ea22-like family protein n=1 Tax=Enterobacter cancerogenus TaxID=69218 RepID=UPI000C9BEF6E|nr:ead/Ea22-like family protein [Enterobacter cancerogenus]PNF13465.1 hypothetical protein A6J71_00735 [Enterobacter cancerogenus]
MSKNATQGNWKFARSGFNAVVQSPAVLQRGGNSFVVICKLFRAEWRGELQTSQDAAFIAAASPATVLALLDELEASKELVELQRFKLERQAEDLHQAKSLESIHREKRFELEREFSDYKHSAESNSMRLAKECVASKMNCKP